MCDDPELGKPAEVLGTQVQEVVVLQVEVEMGKVEMEVEVEERRRLLLIDSSFSIGLHLKALSFHPLLA